MPYKTESFTIIPVQMDPENRDYREITETKEILGQNIFGKDQYGEPIYRDTTNEEYEPTGNKDEYEEVKTGKIFRRDRTKYG